MLVLDDQLSASVVLVPLRRKWVVVRPQSLRPGELILDERIPEILGTERAPTFLTIDQGFWNKSLADPRYCILYFALRDEQQGQVASLRAQTLRVPGFKSRTERMGKVARVSTARIHFWRHSCRELQRYQWRT